MSIFCHVRDMHNVFYFHFLQEIAQETCYNRPSTAPRAEAVTVMVPSPSMDCGPATLTLPTVTCEDITEEKSVSVQFAFRCRHVCLTRYCVQMRGVAGS